MIRPAWAAAAAAVVLVLGGCSEGDHGCGAEDEPEPPRSAGAEPPISISLPPQPPGISGKDVDAALPREKARPSLMDQVLRQLMADTVTMAGAMGRVRPGECEKAVIDRSEGATHRCTVLYEGFEVVWKVQFTDIDSGGWTTAQYRAWSVTGVLAAETVYAAYGRNHPDASLEPRCDRLPKIVQAEVGKASGYECQVLLSECSNGTWRFHRETEPVWINDRGRVAFGEPQSGLTTP